MATSAGRAWVLRKQLLAIAHKVKAGSATVAEIDEMAGHMIELDKLACLGAIPEQWRSGAAASAAEHAAHVQSLNDQISAHVEFHRMVTRGSARIQGAERVLRQTLGQIMTTNYEEEQ